MEFLRFRPRVLDSFKDYTRAQLMSDAMAGIIVAIVAALPLAIAFAIASGSTPEVGLLTAIIGGLIIALLSGTKVQIGGPTGSFILISYALIQSHGVTALIVASMMAGIILIGMALLHLGNLIKYIPYPIVIGYTAGMAVLIFSTQVNELLGLGLKSLPAGFVPKWSQLLQHIGSVDLPTLSIGLLAILIIILIPRITKAVPGSLVAILVTTLLAYALRQWFGVESIATIGDRFEISTSLPEVNLPRLDYSTLDDLIQPALTIAILAAIESLLTASIVDGTIGDRHDPNTELMALGVANLVTPMVGGLPVTGATARTMTNINSGGRTPMAGIIHALVLLVIFLVLMPMISYIPMASLAGVLVVVAINMSALPQIRSILQGPRSDVIVLLTTLSTTLLFDITISIEIGLLLSLLFFMQRMVQSTHIEVSRDELSLISSTDDHHLEKEKETMQLPKGLEVYEIEGPYFFGIAKHFEEIMSQSPRQIQVRIIRMRFVPFMDSTAIYNLSELCRSSQKANILVILSGVHTNIRELLLHSQVMTYIQPEHICSDIKKALALATDYLKAKEAGENTTQTKTP